MIDDFGGNSRRLTQSCAEVHAEKAQSFLKSRTENN